MKNNQKLVNSAFSLQSVNFDRLNDENRLTEHLRGIYREEIMKWAKPGSRILEINCGTGIDSLYFAAKGHEVLAVDASIGMIGELKEKISRSPLSGRISAQICSYESLDLLGERRFDYIISNFGGLNCTDSLGEVLQQFGKYLNKGGKITLVIMPKISPWELIMVVKGKFKTAFRRFGGRSKAQIEGVRFSVFYYNPSFVLRHLKKDYHHLTLRGIYFAVPPEFYQGFVERYEKTYHFLQKVERVFSRYFPFNRCCDHYMISFEKIR